MSTSFSPQKPYPGQSKNKPPPLAGANRHEAECARARELGITIDDEVPGLRPTPMSSSTRTLIVPPTEPAPGPAHRVAPPGVPRRNNPFRKLASPAALRASIENGLGRIAEGDQAAAAPLLEHYADLVAQSEPGNDDVARLRRRVLTAAFGADPGDEPATKNDRCASTRRIQ